MVFNRTKKLELLIVASIFFTILLWLSQLYLNNGWYFTDLIIKNTIAFKYIGKALALATTILICWSFILSANYKIFKLQNLEEQIELNKKITKYAFCLMFLDPILLSLMRIYKPDSILYFFRFRSWSVGYDIGFNVGIVLILLILLLTVILKRKQLDKLAQVFFRSFFGLIPFLILLHIYFLEGDIKRYPLLGVWMLLWLTFAIVSFVKPIFQNIDIRAK